MKEKEEGGLFSGLIPPASHTICHGCCPVWRHQASPAGVWAAEVLICSGLLWSFSGASLGGLCPSLPAGGGAAHQSGEGAGGGRHMAAWQRCLLAGTAAFLWPWIGEQERLSEAAASTDARDR